MFVSIYSSRIELTVVLYRERVYWLSEVGFEPTPTNVDCDLNVAP